MTPRHDLVTFGDVRVDRAAERVWKGDELVDIEPKAFGVLRHLLDHPERLVSKQELLDHVWHGTAVTDNALTRVVAQLRRAIGDDARDARYIETVPTRGYRFIAAIRPVEQGVGQAAAPEVAPATRTAIVTTAAADVTATAADTADAAGAASAPRASRPMTAAAGIAVVLVVVAVGVGAVWMRSAGRRAGNTPDAAAAGAAAGAAAAVPDSGHRAGGLASTPPALHHAAVAQATFSLDLDAYPAFSPDGTMLSYSSLRNGSLDLFVRSFAEGSQTRQVTNDGQQNIQPDWSPDGQFLAYHTLARGGIWVVPANGGTSRQIADIGSAPRWSPDGAWIAYQTGEVHGLDAPATLGPSTIQLARFPGGERRALTRAGYPAGGHSQPSWSSDGRRIVFVSQLVGPGEIWSVDVADGTLTRLLVCGHTCGTPVLAVDGRALFFTVAEPLRGIWRVELSADGRQAMGAPTLLFTPIDSDPLGLTLRRDGRQLAFAVLTVRSNLESIALPAGATRAATTRAAATRAASMRAASMGAASMDMGPPLAMPQPVTQDTSSRNTWPSISPDGARLAFLSKRSGVGRSIWVAALDGSNARQVTLTPTINLLGAWMPNGDEIAYLAEHDRALELRATSITTGRARLIRQVAPRSMAKRTPFMHPRLLPDGHRFVLTRVVDGVGNLWVEAAPGAGGLRQLTHDAESAGFAAVSRDGRWIAYEIVRGRDNHLAVVSSDGGEPRVLTSSPGLYWPHSFTADGDRIAIAMRREGLWRLGWVSRATGEIVPLTATVPANSFVRYPEWSPRGDRVVFEHAKVTGNIWLASLPPHSRAETPGTPE